MAAPAAWVCGVGTQAERPRHRPTAHRTPHTSTTTIHRTHAAASQPQQQPRQPASRRPIAAGDHAEHRPCWTPDAHSLLTPRTLRQVIDRNVKKAMDPTTAASKELMYAHPARLSRPFSGEARDA